MGAGTFRALQGLKMAEVDNSRALAEFRKKLLLHKELDARLKTGKQTYLCVFVCARARVFVSRQNASSRFENRSVFIYTYTKKVFFCFRKRYFLFSIYGLPR